MDIDQRHDTEEPRPSDEAAPDETRVMQLAAGGGFARALAVAARLGIADILDGGRLPYREIAARAGADPDVTRRLMETLTLCGVFDRDACGDYGLTAAFAQLRGGHPRSLRHFCVLMAETYDDAFAGLLGTVTTGESGFERVFGKPLYAHLEGDPEAERVFDAAMAELARPVVAELARRADFGTVRRVIDIGGGDGTVLAGVLAAHPRLEGVCVDRPSVCERARARLRAEADPQPAAERLTFRPADIFAEVPAGGDRYLLKNVLHDWDAERRLRILAVVREAMLRTAAGNGAGNGAAPRLLIVEPIQEGDLDGAHTLFQMVMCGKGAEVFTEPEMHKLVQTAGFTLLSAERLAGGHHLFECTAVAS
ncbi:methyltransferase [Streptomyces sp. P1-3]|uniref:methyltransferase n=1 Tax=Streptomyces sp. P1-3 TaxID=3421658 RepID=UPI003D36963B